MGLRGFEQGKGSNVSKEKGCNKPEGEKVRGVAKKEVECDLKKSRLKANKREVQSDGNFFYSKGKRSANSLKSIPKGVSDESLLRRSERNFAREQRSGRFFGKAVL